MKNATKNRVEQWADDIRAHLDSPEGKASMSAFFDKINKRHEVEDRQVDRFWAKCGNDKALDAFVERCMDWYGSDTYRDREYFKRKCEPREPLFSFLRSVAEKHGRELTRIEYAQYEDLSEFTSDVFVLGNWYLELVVGQGAFIRVTRKPS